MNAKLMVVGPFPPPTHGFAEITRQLADRAQDFGDVERLNVASNAANPISRHLSQLGKNTRAAWKIATAPLQGCRTAAIGVNGGLGLIYTVFFTIAARLSGVSASLHHHSYGYIDNPNALMRAICAIAGQNIRHVFLSDAMRCTFEDVYGTRDGSLVLPNAIFVPAVPQTQAINRAPSVRLRIGLLSNLSAEKGLHDFILTARALRNEGLDVTMVLAGPIALASDRDLTEEAQKEGIIEWVGPKHGEEKAQFFSQLDLFLFPTRYKYEAQPTVIYEAFSHGVPVIAFARGSVADQVGDCVSAIARHESFVSQAVAFIRSMMEMNERERLNLRVQAHGRHAAHAAQGYESLEELFRDDKVNSPNAKVAT